MRDDYSKAYSIIGFSFVLGRAVDLTHLASLQALTSGIPG
jgi:hypothetical protein